MKPKILKFKNRNLKFRKAAGFTLIEVLVSLFIFGTALTAISFIFSSSVLSATTAKNNVIASSLAQEGVEVMNNLRHNDWLNGRTFGSFGEASVLPDDTYRVQWDSVKPVSLALNPFLKKDTTTGIFNYDTGSDTSFRRTVAIQTIAAGIHKRITVAVTWTDNRGNTKTLTAESHLFNWR